MKTVQGDVGEHLVVEDDTTVQGTVTEGATVKAHRRLVVRGVLGGTLNVEQEACAEVQGTFDGDIGTNDGLVLLYGIVALTFRPGIGRVVVGIDSVLTASSPSRLLPDGTVEYLEPGTYGPGSFNIRTDRVCYYDAATDRFEPLPEVTAGTFPDTP